MRWISSGCTCGKNVWENIYGDGETIIRENGIEKLYKIKDGDIDEVIIKSPKLAKDDSGNKNNYNRKTHLKYFNFFKEWRNGKLVIFDNYKHRKTSKHGICFDKTGLLLNEVGKLETRYSHGSKLWEKFWYSNRKLAYYVRHNTNKITVYYPNKKVWICIEGIDKTCFNLKGWGITILDMINHIFKEDWEHVVRNLTDTRSFNLKIYDKSGSITHKGSLKNGQLVGEWIWNGEKRYLLQGVMVNETVFKTPPEELDPNEVLQIANTQLRAALFSKIGYEKVIQKCNGKVIHQDGEMTLFSVPMVKGKLNRTWGNPETDDILMLLKVRCPSTGVYYVLRVPPDMTNCEQARQWTFGLNTRPQTDAKTGEVTFQVKPEDYYQFVEET